VAGHFLVSRASCPRASSVVSFLLQKEEEETREEGTTEGKMPSQRAGETPATLFQPRR